MDEPKRTAGTPADPLYDRNLAIVTLSGVGWAHGRIARLFGITPPRVDQIVSRYHCPASHPDHPTRMVCTLERGHKGDHSWD
jgi:predicted ArsR family transcriptional regulator